MLIAAVAFTVAARMLDHWPVCTQYIVGPLIVCPFEDSWHVRNGTSSDGNSNDEVVFFSTTVSYTSCLMCPQRTKSRHVRSGDLVYESVVETEEDLVARIAIAVGTIVDMPGIFERTRQSMVRRCIACIQANDRAFEQFL